MSQIVNSLTKITADGSYWIEVDHENDEYEINVDFETPGTAGTITLQDHQQNTYYLNGTALTTNFNHVAGGTNNKWIVKPSGGNRVYLLAASFAGSPVVAVRHRRIKTSTH